MKKNIFLFSLLTLKVCLSTSQLVGIEPGQPGYIIKCNGVTIINNSFYNLLVSNQNQDNLSISETYINACGDKRLINFSHHYSVLPIVSGNDFPTPVENIFTGPILTISSRKEGNVNLIQGHDQDKQLIFSQPIIQPIAPEQPIDSSEEEVANPEEEYEQPTENPDYQSDGEEAPELVAQENGDEEMA